MGRVKLWRPPPLFSLTYKLTSHPRRPYRSPPFFWFHDLSLSSTSLNPIPNPTSFPIIIIIMSRDWWRFSVRSPSPHPPLVPPTALSRKMFIDSLRSDILDSVSATLFPSHTPPPRARPTAFDDHLFFAFDFFFLLLSSFLSLSHLHLLLQAFIWTSDVCLCVCLFLFLKSSIFFWASHVSSLCASFSAAALLIEDRLRDSMRWEMVYNKGIIHIQIISEKKHAKKTYRRKYWNQTWQTKQAHNLIWHNSSCTREGGI